MTDQIQIAKSRKALGRGLDALLSRREQPGHLEVDVDRIQPNPKQPRKRIDADKLKSLADSIREHGVVQPPVVMSVGDDRYQLIVGERRWQAARLAGLQRVTVVVKEASDQESLELALVENVQRADLNPIEEAAAYQRLNDDFGLTHEEVASRVGKSRAAVSNLTRLLGLPEDVREALINEEISEGHGRAILRLEDRTRQASLLHRIITGNLTVRQTEDIVTRVLEGRARKASRTHKTPEIELLEDELRRSLGTKVAVRQRKRGGRIIIDYYSEEEFEGLYQRLTEGRF
jgi:ParB family transcriptional regulator, chromosome partitioning protein